MRTTRQRWRERPRQTVSQPFSPHAFHDNRATDILLNPGTADPCLEAAFALQTSRQMVQLHCGLVEIEKRTEQDDVAFLRREARAWDALEDGCWRGPGDTGRYAADLGRRHTLSEF